jgi:endoglucanase
MKISKMVGIGLIVIALAILGFVWFKNSSDGDVPLVFSEKSMLQVLWKNYKSDYLEAGSFRAVDKQQNNITTSEGQSYTMLRAVWMDDKTTFDAAYKWTNDNLRRKNDHLFSWLYGENSDGTYSIQTAKGGYNTANDADTDIALSLIFAHARWNDQNYLNDAKNIVNDLWNTSVITIKGVPYMTADDLEKTSSIKPIINPSYLAPYSYKIFATIDPSHDWNAVASSSYAVLNATADLPLDKQSSDGLPADWVVIDRTTGTISAPDPSTNLNTDFSYDALRAPWRVALDYQWSNDPRAKAYLDRLGFLKGEWESKKMIYSDYGHDGSTVSTNEAPAMYGGTIGYFMYSDPADAVDIYNQKIKYLFNSDTNTWKSDMSYYDSNWVWFGMGLYNNLLPNLAR